LINIYDLAEKNISLVQLSNTLLKYCQERHPVSSKDIHYSMPYLIVYFYTSEAYQLSFFGEQ